MIILGLVTILTMQASLIIRLPACVLWLLFSGRELLVIVSGYLRIRRIRLYSNGEVELRNNSGDWQAARLANGSVILDGFAWLRIEACDGRRSVELLRGTSRKNEEWRRLQVIRRHLGAAVGS